MTASVLRRAAAAILAALNCASTACAHEFNPLMVAPQPQSEAAQVNEFICNSGTGGPGAPADKVATVRLRAALLCALNSDFNHPGDAVTAVVMEPTAVGPGRVLPAGAVLRGHVEDCRPGTRPRTDGSVRVRFSALEIHGRRFPVNLVPEGTLITPAKKCAPASGKEILRRVLLLSSGLAIPLAIGTGGISLAIATGAGAVIGAALADDRKYFRGAVRGAWEAAGLSVFDPVVYRGKSVTVASGSEIFLTNSEPFLIDRRLLSGSPANGNWDNVLAARRAGGENPALPLLTTSARIIDGGSEAGSESTPQTADPLAEIDEFISQKNLAKAMQSLEMAAARSPNDPRLAERRRELLDFVTGRSTDYGSRRTRERDNSALHRM